MTAPLHFPRSLMRDRRWKLELIAKTASGGRAFSGQMPVARMDGGGLWSLMADGVQVSSADNIRAWRAIGGYLDGGATDITVPLREDLTQPWPTINGVTVTSGFEALHSDLSTFSDSTDYSSQAISASASSAALRATVILINVAIGGALRGGELFSIQHTTHLHKPYRIISTTDLGGGTYLVNIRPPLREAFAGGAVDFDVPKCVMHLAKSDQMDLSLERRIYGEGVLGFLESFPPYNT
jgi:hypothetical protein